MRRTSIAGVALAGLLAVLALSAHAQPRVAGFRKPHKGAVMVQQGFLWIDAEDFTDYGGWTLDTQFVHLMGSGYLLAASAGEPVKDAVTQVDVASPGDYTLWVRARNWFPEHSPGRFRVLVNGRPLEPVFGVEPSGKWTWQAGGKVALRRGPATIALHDLTGYFGRCDALILTRDAKYRPPADTKGVVRERARLTGLSLEPKDGGDFDVIVVGAGAAGCCAAIAAARGGAETALVQNRPVLGGNSSNECGVPLNGAAGLHPFARETGLAEEVGRVKARYGLGYYGEAFEKVIADEPGLTVFRNQHVFDVVMAAKDRIAAVKAVNTLDSTMTTYRAHQFIDCTGDGWVGYFAKADFRLGREARDEYDESLAPEQADDITMSGCLMGNGLGFRAEKTNKPAPYTPPPWAVKLPSREAFGRHVRRVTSGEWWLEHPGTVDDLWGAERARDELIRISFGYWDFIKNQSELRDEARTFRLAAIPYMDAKRESRRLLGDYILTQNDTQAGRVFPDRISYGGWPLDVHHPRGILSGKEGPFDCDARVPIYTIPYRCLYSRNIENLLFAGRCMSVTHIALGTVRVQSTLATCGQAAGTAAALCLQHKTTPRGIYRDHLKELQQTLLKNDQTIPELVNEDPNDLARSARAVTASSTATFVAFGKADVELEARHPLNMDRGMLLPTGNQGHLKSIFLFLDSSRKEPVQLALRLHPVASSEDAPTLEHVATVAGTVPPKSHGWVEFPLDRELSSPYTWVTLPHEEGLFWRLMAGGPPGSHRGYGNLRAPSWTPVKAQHYACYTEPPLHTPTGFRASNVINGKFRIRSSETNMWASDPAQLMPQWLELDFGKDVTFNCVQLTFDTNQDPRLHIGAHPSRCIRDYELAVYDGQSWRTVCREAGNFQRHRVHLFAPVTGSRLRLSVIATNGDRSARVFEVRAYRE